MGNRSRLAAYLEESDEVQGLTDAQFKQIFGFYPPRGTSDVRKFIDGVAAQLPELWQFCYPRWYRNTDQYLSAKLPAQCMFMCALDALGITHVEPSLTETALFSTTIKAQRYRFPHFYVAPELFRAISMSEPPPEMRWDTLDLPFDAALFMLPRKTLFHPENGEVAWLMYSRLRNGEAITMQAGPHRWHKQCGNTAFTVCWECHDWRPNPPAFHMTLTDTVNPYISTADIAACLDVAKGAIIDESSWLAIPMVAGEAQFSELAVSLVFRLLLAMDAKPQLIERGRYTGKKLCSAHQPEIWDPNIIGRTYTIHRARTGTGTGGGWSVRMHWKRGHYKQVPHGPQHSLRKTAWIEPYMVGGD